MIFALMLLSILFCIALMFTVMTMLSAGFKTRDWLILGGIGAILAIIKNLVDNS